MRSSTAMPIAPPSPAIRPKRATDAASPLRPPLPQAGAALRWRNLFGSSRGLAIAAAARQHSGPVLVITADVRTAQQIEDEIGFYDAGIGVWPFPDWESLPYDAFSPHPDIISRRLDTLRRLPTLTHGVVVVALPTLLHRLSPRTHIDAHAFTLQVGNKLDLNAFRQQLAAASYQHVAQVMAPGEFALRGGLLDLFPMGADAPYRIDLFDDRIDSIRLFDAETQRSGAKLDAVELLPAREYPFSAEAIQKFRHAFRARFEGDPQSVALYRDVSQGLNPAGIEYYLPLFFPQLATLFDYVPANALCILQADVATAAAQFARDVQARYESLRHDRQRPILPPSALFLDPEELQARLAPYARVALVPPECTDTSVGFATAAPVPLPVDPKSERPYGGFADYVRGFPGRVLVVAETAGRREVLSTLMRDHGLDAAPCAGWAEFCTQAMPLALTTALLDRGVVLDDPPIAIVAESQLYGERAVQRRRRSAGARDPDAVIRSLAELKPGDPVVHEDHGVGRYLGLQTMSVGDIVNEFLTLEYADGDKLYIPVTALQLISRYTGTDPEHAPLHKLGSDAWDKAKRRAREKAHDAAVELLELYALREARQGYAFAAPDAQYMAFAADFPFEETPDQSKVIEEVLGDMQSTRPMDRLVCGDVGFGKTEIAMRAAFLAVQDHKQVAVLVPTTLLAQQHFQNFSDRFANLPVKIELLSRFRTKAEQLQALAELHAGKVDIVIGTHRLLQSDVRFYRLGLVIIDEEHRFGVRQKERMKKLRAEVDVLTLTATPVPRTLNMALATLRDISLITTPPQARLAIKTFVVQWNDVTIREAFLREMRRGGQVYFLHNDVKTMDTALQRLQKLVPGAEIRIAHGQMPERELERVMLDFYHQRFNVLLCSTIIETGIDVPTANTIIIERADKFGLAQLHQLRGRVGRSHHRAYAYLIVPPGGMLTGDAQKRLDAISSLEELGVGFALASHDLEIRGAGELLGEAQSGQIDEIGFSLYTELLNRAVATLKAGKSLDVAIDWDRPGVAEIDLHAPALLPDDYVPDPHLRLVLYKRIAGARDKTELEELHAEVIDRFGSLPPAGAMLFKVTALKQLAGPLGVRKIDAGPKGAKIEFNARPNVDPTHLIALLQSAPRVYRLEGGTRLRITQDLPTGDARVAALSTLLKRLGAAG